MKLHHQYAILLLLLSLVTACDLFAPDLVDYKYDGFSIALPTREPVTRTEEGPDGIIGSVSTEVQGVKYLVVYWELPLYLRGISDQEIIETMSLGAGAWKVIKQEKVTMAGMPSREIVGESATGKPMITRMVRTKDRVYLLTVGGGKKAPSVKTAGRFFDSFRLPP